MSCSSVRFRNQEMQNMTDQPELPKTAHDLMRMLFTKANQIAISQNPEKFATLFAEMGVWFGRYEGAEPKGTKEEPMTEDTKRMYQ